MRVATLLVGWLPLLCSAAEDWSKWEECPATGRRLQEETSKPGEVTAQGQWSDIFDRYANYHQIITINQENGKLEIMGSASPWEKLQALEEPVKIVVNFGKPNAGKSTIMSMMSCEMAGEEAVLFPVRRDKTSPQQEYIPYTKGIWATKPFPHRGADGRLSQYMLMDMQSQDRTQVDELTDLSYKMEEDMLIKMLALMSEVASVFVYVVAIDELTSSNWATIGKAFQSTRKNMVLRSKYVDGGSSAVDKKLDLKAHNDPALILATRGRQDIEHLVLENSFEANTAFFETKATTAWNALCGERDAKGKCDVFANLLEENFASIPHKNGNFPFTYNPLPLISEDSRRDNSDFNWNLEYSYKFEQGDSCRRYQKMNSSRWQCGSKGPARPSDPSTYKLMIQSMVGLLEKEAPVRQVSWVGQETPVPLTGKRLQELLSVGIAEMNAIGPLPQTELWRRIMQDRCRGELWEWLDFTYGESSGLYLEEQTSGLLKQVDNGLDNIRKNPPATLPEYATRWKGLRALWTDAKPMTEGMIAWFGKHPLLQSVQTTCLAAGEVRATLINQTWDTYEEEWNVIYETKRRQDTEAELRRAQDQIRKLKLQNFWEKNKVYILAGSVLAMILCVVLCRIWQQVNSTCRVCAGCCGDWGDTTSTTKIITVEGSGGKIITGSHTESIARPLASAVAVSEVGGKPLSTADLQMDSNQRLNQLGDQIKELQRRVSQENLPK